ncbi:MAG: CmcI family methyltransferase [Xanthobacteraceae bacterium]|nr:CmcI family methyltransferase [Xanthobacteraceae bacterium]
MRPFKTAFDPDFLSALQRGVLDYTYKGIACLKSPLDLAIYTKLIWDLKPRTLIEIGTYKGGSALWFADPCSSFDLSTRILSIDAECRPETSDHRIEFLKGDVRGLGHVLTPERMAGFSHPILVVEDSAHTHDATLAALRFFNHVLGAGDVMIVEDGVLDELDLSDQYDGGPNRAIGEFLAEPSCRFEIMANYCDLFGPNATYNPNGYLRVTR